MKAIASVADPVVTGRVVTGQAAIVQEIEGRVPVVIEAAIEVVMIEGRVPAARAALRWASDGYRAGEADLG